MSEASGHFKAKNMMPFYVALFMMLFSSVLIRFVPPSTRLCTTTSARQSTRRSTRTPARHSSPPSTKRNARPSKNFKGFLLKRIQPKPYFSGTTPSLRRSVRQRTRRRTRKFAKLSTTPSSTQSVRPSTRPWLRRSVSWSELSQIFNNRSWMKHNNQVRGCVQDGVRNCVRHSDRAKMRNPVRDRIHYWVWHRLRNCLWDQVWGKIPNKLVGARKI